jgi:hypothetical protein
MLHPMRQEEYFSLLNQRAKQSHAYRAFQTTGTDVADILGDQKHIALYIKIAKTVNAQVLLQTAKLIMQNNNVRNPGAYFMRIAKEKGWLTDSVAARPSKTSHSARITKIKNKK